MNPSPAETEYANSVDPDQLETMSYKKKTLYVKRAHSNQLVILLLIFILMKKRISSEYVLRMKVPSVLKLQI